MLINKLTVVADVAAIVALTYLEIVEQANIVVQH